MPFDGPDNYQRYKTVFTQWSGALSAGWQEVVWDSLAIIEYLAETSRRFGQPQALQEPMRGQSAAKCMLGFTLCEGNAP